MSPATPARMANLLLADCRWRHRSAPYYSTNITPDKATGIGDYSYDDFQKAVRQGVAKNGDTLYPAIPYPSYVVVTISRLAVKPDVTPAIAASRPATGWRPTARKISAPSGGITTSAASEDMWLKKAINSTI